jgi:DNA-directed RNA polymerase specialized sigma24 family protein
MTGRVEMLGANFMTNCKANHRADQIANRVTNQVASDKASHGSAAYASGADFCRIFKEDMDRLYLLSFLLTVDRATAEKCFVQGLEDAQRGNPVFKEWAQSWARRAVVGNAIRMMHPRPELATAHHSVAAELESLPTGASVEAMTAARAESFAHEIAAIIALPPFQRFAFVLSVLEGYSNREAALLLDCSVTELVTARTHALQQIGGHPEIHRKLAGIDATEASLANAGAAYAKEVMSHLAAPA